jgi:hypothetical protein
MRREAKVAGSRKLTGRTKTKRPESNTSSSLTSLEFLRLVYKKESSFGNFSEDKENGFIKGIESSSLADAEGTFETPSWRGDGSTPFRGRDSGFGSEGFGGAVELLSKEPMILPMRSSTACSVTISSGLTGVGPADLGCGVEAPGPEGLRVRTGEGDAALKGAEAVSVPGTPAADPRLFGSNTAVRGGGRFV